MQDNISKRRELMLATTGQLNVNKSAEPAIKAGWYHWDQIKSLRVVGYTNEEVHFKVELEEGANPSDKADGLINEWLRVSDKLTACVHPDATKEEHREYVDEFLEFKEHQVARDLPDQTYTIVYEESCWPKTNTPPKTKEFADKNSAMLWIKEMYEWATLEGNKFHIWHGYDAMRGSDNAINPDLDYYAWERDNKNQP